MIRPRRIASIARKKVSNAELLPGFVTARCVCSTLGYEHPLWNADYYPEQCPEEWRLAYFMNDFQAVYLRPDDWCREDEQLEAIAGELEDGRFELVLEWPLIERSEQIRRLLDALKPVQGHIACMVLDADTLSPALLREVCEGLGARFPVNFLAQTQEGRRAVCVQGREAGIVWTPSQGESLIPGDDYQVVRLPFRKLREIKPVLAQLRPLLDRNIRVGVFLEPHAQAPQRALEVRTLIELMGLA